MDKESKSVCYHHYCKTPYNNPNVREDIEWSNTWYSNANQSVGGGKLLLIGDSTGRKIRSTLERISGRPTDFLGTSAGLHDLMFCSQLDSFFEPVTWTYDTIFVWIGYHSLKNHQGEYYNSSDFDLFEMDMRNLVDYLAQYGSRIVLCSALYPVVKKDKMGLLYQIWFHLKPISRLFKEKIIEDEAAVIKRKNSTIEKIAKEKSLVFCDINGYMLSLCENYMTRCIHYDKIHYEGKSFPYIVRYLCNVLY